MLYYMNWLTHDFWTRTVGWEFDRSHGAGTSSPSHWRVEEQAPKPVGWMMCLLLMTFIPVQKLCVNIIHLLTLCSAILIKLTPVPMTWLETLAHFPQVPSLVLGQMRVGLVPNKWSQRAWGIWSGVNFQQNHTEMPTVHVMPGTLSGGFELSRVAELIIFTKYFNYLIIMCLTDPYLLDLTNTINNFWFR